MSAHVRDLMVCGLANGLGTIPNLEKIVAFLKSLAYHDAQFLLKR